MKILALDLGKSKSVCCLLDTDSGEVQYQTITTTAAAIDRRIHRSGAEHLVLEVCTLAGWVHDVGVSAGVKVHVANPNHEGWRWRNVKRKTDRLDALKLAELMAMRQLPEVHVPRREVREHRALIEYRGQLVSRRTRIKNTIRSLVLRQGLSFPSGKEGWTLKARQQLAALALPWEQASGLELWRGQLGEELGALNEIESRLSRVEGRLDALARTDDRIRRLRTIPCVGPRTAEMLVAVLDDPHRFKTGKQVGSYVGLVPRQYQSGQMDRQGRISKQGNRRLRSLLVEVSWLALRYNPQLSAIYHRLCRGTRSRRKIAIVAVARRLLVIAWAMLRDGTDWSPGRVAA
jgi:transposase